MGEAGAFYYRPVPDGAVTIDRRHEAERALRFAREMLPEIPAAAKIVWVEPAVDQNAAATDGLLVRIENNLRDLLPHDMRAGKRAEARFQKSSEGAFWGQVQGPFSRNMILISTEVPFENIAYIIGHEAKHAADFGLYRPPHKKDKEQRKIWEDRAVDFGRKVEARAWRKE